MPRVQQKRGTAANLSSVNPTPLAGELLVVSDENTLVIGNGSDAYTSLAYVTATPRSHTQAWSTITDTPTTLSAYGITDAVGSSDARLTDSRTPTAHKSSHATGGSDALSPADIGAAPTASPEFTGFVGINANPSTRRLTVRGSSTADGALLLQSSSTGTGTTNGFIIQCFGAASDAYVWNFENAPIIFGANNAERMRLTAAGDLGLGPSRTAPASRLDVNGVITVSATSGSAGAYAPSLTFSGDPNTGFGQVSGQSDTASIFTAGHERVRVDASGRLGVGTTPSHALDVASTSAVSARIRRATVGGQANLRVEDGDGSYYDLATVGNVLAFINNTSERMRIDASGRLAIGTATASSLLTVNGVITVSATGGSAGSYLPSVCFASDPNTGFGQVAGQSDTASIFTAGAERVRVTSGGSVGVGLTSPATAGTGKVALDVNGPVIARGGVAAHQTSGGVIDLSGDVTRLRAYGATSGSGAIDLRIGGGGDSADAHGARLDSSANLILGSTVSPTGSRVLVLVNGTPPSASIGDCVMLYSEDVSASAELKVRDQAGNVTTLSPHNFTLIPEGPSEPMAWAYYSERDGHRINVDMLRLARLVERLTGEKLVYEE